MHLLQHLTRTVTHRGGQIKLTEDSKMENIEKYNITLYTEEALSEAKILNVLAQQL